MSEGCTHNCETCNVGGCKDREKQSLRVPANKRSRVKKVIAVVSGKGGVGKSMVTSLLSVISRRNGYNTAIIDADITGPSIPKTFQVNEKALTTEDSIIPVTTKSGIKLMSINLLLDDETKPVIWRGPILAGTVKQFWSDVVWEDVDIMFVDCPPGTGDVPLTVFQSLPVDGIVVVTSPQDLVSMIVKKAVNMADMMHVPIIGIVENMSYFVCDRCEEKHFIYGDSNIEGLAKAYGIQSIARLPIKKELRALVDRGDIESFEGDWLNLVFEAIEQC